MPDTVPVVPPGGDDDVEMSWGDAEDVESLRADNDGATFAVRVVDVTLPYH